MGKFYALLFLLMALLLGNCTYVNTHRAFADRGRQCRAIVLPDQENLVLYQHHGKLYLQGVLTEVRRVGRDKVSSFATEYTSGQYLPIKGAPQRYVYRELSAADMVPAETFVLKAGSKIPKGAHAMGPRRAATAYQIDSLNCNPNTTLLQQGWLEQLPRHAHRVHRNMVTSEHQNTGNHVCSTRNGFIIPVTRMRANAHAWYAYPLAGASFVTIDVPGTLLANTVVPVAYGIAAIPCSIYQKISRIFSD